MKFLTWLLVPIFPLFGMFIGIWLMPEWKPRWEVHFPGDIAVNGLGFVDDGKTLLLIETKVELPRRLISNNAFGLIGLKAETGEQLFRTPLSEELLKGEGVHRNHANLTSDGQGILFNHRVSVDPPEDTYDEIVVYQWKTQQIIKRYRSVYSNGVPNEPMLRGSTLAAMGSAQDSHNLILWNGVDDKPANLPFPNDTYDFGLSNDGVMIHVCSAYTTSPFQLTLVDAKKQKVMQAIEGHFREVRWAADNLSFLAIEYDPKQKVHFARRYQLIDQQYEADPASKVVIAHTDNISRNKPYLTMTTYTQVDPWRTKVSSWLGDHLKFIVDRIWPEGQIVQLLDEKTGRPLHRLVFPKEVRGSTLVHSSGQSVAMCGTRTVSLWDFHSASRWYPIYGLLVGLVIGALLAWKLLRRSPRASKVPATA